ncbi:uncharacterized protein LOC106459214 isoform X3 [Limulus polyphemus]|uniref:Regulator of microtubule dynamics protein 1 n=1 Tax=Limulus polyphemus TaxID=6850 RepID=A0ABM1SCL2_LIMPO|nr:uncharacterized protein LOC106459214 isoform X3 [Limulus polyphemus]
MIFIFFDPSFSKTSEFVQERNSVIANKKYQIQNGSTHEKWNSVLVKVFHGCFALRVLTFLKEQHESAEQPLLVDEDKIIKEADRLYLSHQYREIYKVLYPYSSSSSDEILWRLARATFEVGRASDSEKDAIVWLEEAYGYVERALGLNERNGSAHKWCAILTDYVMRYRSIKDRISKSVDVRHHFERALELTPTDATVHFLLGQCDAVEFLVLPSISAVGMTYKTQWMRMHCWTMQTLEIAMIRLAFWTLKHCSTPLGIMTTEIWSMGSIEPMMLIDSIVPVET